jgi:enoyl-CoA hydratase/carnithine racemase
MPSAHLHIEHRDAVALVRLTRPLKRNALNDGLIADLQQAFDHMPPRYAPRCCMVRAITFALAWT